MFQKLRFYSCEMSCVVFGTRYLSAWCCVLLAATKRGFTEPLLISCFLVEARLPSTPAPRARDAAAAFLLSLPICRYWVVDGAVMGICNREKPNGGNCLGRIAEEPDHHTFPEHLWFVFPGSDAAGRFAASV